MKSDDDIDKRRGKDDGSDDSQNGMEFGDMKELSLEEFMKLLEENMSYEEIMELKKVIDNASNSTDGDGRKDIGIAIIRASVPTSASAVQERETMELPGKYDVIFHNDDYTPMGFVVEILVKLFDKEREDAVNLMMDIHQNGKGIAGTYIKSIAETKVMLVRKMSQEANYPLHVTMEKAG